MVKKLLPLLLFLSFYIRVQSQDYIPMINESLSWDVGHIGMGYICEYSGNPERYYFSGDTVINGTTYKTVYTYNSRSLSGYNPPYCSPFLLDTVPGLSDIYIREDISTRRVYRYRPEYDEEILLFDFSIGVGDTIPIEGLTMIVDSVWTITTPDNVTRRVYKSDWGYPEIAMIEGIGGNCGPFSQPSIWFENYAMLMCVKNNGQNIYGERCIEMLTVSTPTLNLTEIKCYPNPAKDIVTIELPSGVAVYDVTLINSEGKVLQKEYSSAPILKLDLSDYNPGVYLIKVIGNKETFITKVVKEIR